MTHLSMKRFAFSFLKDKKQKNNKKNLNKTRDPCQIRLRLTKKRCDTRFTSKLFLKIVTFESQWHESALAGNLISANLL